VVGILGLSFMLAGIPFVLAFCWGLWVDVSLDFLGREELHAVVTRSELRKDIRYNKRHPTEIHFRYEVGGASFDSSSLTLDGALIREAQPGARLPVEVAHVNPRWARLPGATYSIFGYFGAFAVVFPIVGFGMALGSWRSNRREIHAFTYGIPAAAKVIFRGANRSTRSKKRHPHEVRWSFEAEDGRTYEGSISHMDKRVLDEALPGDELVVLYDRTRPTTNTAWIA
jgi:hypothetical protein